MDIVITWCEIDRGFRMRLEEKGSTLLEDNTVYPTKAELMSASYEVVKSYFKIKGELK